MVLHIVSWVNLPATAVVVQLRTIQSNYKLGT